MICSVRNRTDSSLHWQNTRSRVRCAWRHFSNKTLDFVPHMKNKVKLLVCRSFNHRIFCVSPTCLCSVQLVALNRWSVRSAGGKHNLILIQFKCDKLVCDRWRRSKEPNQILSLCKLRINLILFFTPNCLLKWLNRRWKLLFLDGDAALPAGWNKSLQIHRENMFMEISS